MRSIGIIRNSHMWHFQFSIEVLTWRGTVCWKTHLNRPSGSKVMRNWRAFRTIENNRNKLSFFFFWLYFTINAADSDWSRQIATQLSSFSRAKGRDLEICLKIETWFIKEIKIIQIYLFLFINVKGKLVFVIEYVERADFAAVMF